MSRDDDYDYYGGDYALVDPSDPQGPVIDPENPFDPVDPTDPTTTSAPSTSDFSSMIHRLKIKVFLLRLLKVAKYILYGKHAELSLLTTPARQSLQLPTSTAKRGKRGGGRFGRALIGVISGRGRP